MRIVVFPLILMVGLLIGCDSVDPYKRAFDIEFLSWYAIKIDSHRIRYQDKPTYFHKETATKFIEKYQRYCLQEANVLLGKWFILNKKNLDKEVENIEQWLKSLGIQRITFRQSLTTDTTIIRDYDEGEVVVREIDKSGFDEATYEEKWKDCILDSEELKKLWKISQNESLSKVGMIVLNIIDPASNGGCFYDGFSAGPPPSWSDASQSLSYRKWKLAEDVWHYLAEFKKDEATAYHLLELLKKADTRFKKRRIINALMNYQWCPKAESDLLAIANNSTETMEIRILAMQTILKRCDTEKYISTSINLIYLEKKKTTRCYFFQVFTSEIKDFTKLQKANSNLIIRVGFKLLMDLKDEELEHGQSAANNLGKFVKVKFYPDHNDPEYKDRDYKFVLIDTVKNALKWWDQNQSKYN